MNKAKDLTLWDGFTNWWGRGQNKLGTKLL